MSSTRQIAVIMFTDIVGYTAMMGKNEKEALTLLRKNKEIHNKWLKQFNGKWLKEMGDGILSSFQTISDAVYCAGSILKETETIENLNLRIGIHLGEVEVDGNELYGDGVNIASRIEGIAESGQLLVSETIYNNIRNKEGIDSTFMGEHELKNVGQPVKIYSVEVKNVPAPKERASQKNKWILSIITFLALMAVVYFYAIPLIKQGSSPASEFSGNEVIEKSIVVLPFTNMSNDPEQEYFSDGMMEELLNQLVKIEDLKVISRTTSMNYKNSDKSLREIASELGVATVLEGSVRKDGDNVRITVQLIEGNTDIHLFSESYTRKLTSIFDVQSEVAQLVASALQAQVTPEVKMRIESIPTNNSHAYELYLRGREQISQWWPKWDIQLIHKGIDYYNEAIELDPVFSNAYVGLGQAYWMLAHWAPDYDPVYWDLSKEYLNKAIALDPDNGWAYAELGVVLHNWDWDQQGALNAFKKAVELSPGDWNVHNHYKNVLFRIKDCDGYEREARILHSIENQEYNPNIDFDLLLCRKNLDQIFKLNLTNYSKSEIRRLLMFQGKYKEFITFATDSSNVGPDDLFTIGALGEAYALTGDSLNAIGVINDLNELSLTRHVSKCTFAPIYLALGDEDTAFELLEEALEERDLVIHVLDWMYVSFFRIQDDPRYVDLLERSWIPQEE